MKPTEYSRKRKRESTTEPFGGKSNSRKLAFVVQRHKATTLHYDFRLEMDGVLRSWAIPHGPSMNPEDKRLAIMVEDHPFDYGKFKGNIPKGNYGAGIVEIWDKGYYTPAEPATNPGKILKAGLQSGDLKIILHGKKIKGGFALVKIRNDVKGNSWLLIKHKDQYSVDGPYNSEDYTSGSSPINRYLQSKREKPDRKKKENPLLTIPEP